MIVMPEVKLIQMHLHGLAWSSYKALFLKSLIVFQASADFSIDGLDVAKVWKREGYEVGELRLSLDAGRRCTSGFLVGAVAFKARRFSLLGKIRLRIHSVQLRNRHVSTRLQNSASESHSSDQISDDTSA